MEYEVTEPESIELVAMLGGLQVCINWGFINIIIESDCLLIIQDLQNEEDSLSLMENLLKKIKRLMKIFTNCRVQHLPL